MPLSFSHDLYCQSPNCMINNLCKFQISIQCLVVPISKMAKIRPQQMSESTTILQNIVIPAVCSHISRCLIRFDNQKMTAVLTLLSFWQICFSEAVWRLWLQKSLKIGLGFRGPTTKGFVGVYRAVQKPQRGLKASLSLCLAWVGPTWQLSGCRDFHYDVVVREYIAR